jgi:hypothetical protein
VGAVSVPSSVQTPAATGRPAQWRLAVAESYTAIGLAATRPASRSPGAFEAAVSGRVAVPGRVAVSGRVAVRRVDRDVQRWVHPHVSRQYQRTSGQALPPSATIEAVDKRIPHIQHDLTWADSPPKGAGCDRLVMTCSPRSPAVRAVVSARAVGLSTVIGVRPVGRSSSESPTLMPTLPVHLGDRRAAATTPRSESRDSHRHRDGMATGTLRTPALPVPAWPHATCRTCLPLSAYAHHLWIPISHRSNL